MSDCPLDCRVIPGTDGLYWADAQGRVFRKGKPQGFPPIRPAVSRGVGNHIGSPVLRLSVHGRLVRMSATTAVGNAWWGQAPEGFAWRLVDHTKPLDVSLKNIEARPTNRRRTR